MSDDTDTTWADSLLADLASLPTLAEPRNLLPPLLATGQRQGDVFVQPDQLTITRRHEKAAVWLADGQDVVIVPEGHQHLLRVALNGTGKVRAWAHRQGNTVLTVEIFAPAYCLLVQPFGPNPHPPIGIAPGQYAICRQSEPVVYVQPAAPRNRPMTWQERHANTFVID